ncbi:AraC family transcriptional regulator [Klebsiella sp. BIGb0407]|uniref:helix-turn-helix transcriptional regulator n=1 Tax=Klebsiella sp. BIGb0407 TaxID=2940603 RepID=UPI002167C56F|nr:AraC family transcriptional regulator [Klebsiella sp. BIGb0407]MCS3431745.1 AraC-like DNA-binding protein [Klebsiella sp. BIGb0407]
MRVLTLGQLDKATRDLGGKLRFRHELSAEQPVLAGWQRVLNLDNGLVLYLSQSEDLIDACSQNLLSPGITASFLVQGQAAVDIAGQRLCFDTCSGRQRAMLINLTDSDQFQRHWQTGRRETKISLSFSPAWFEQFSDDYGLCSDKLLQFRRAHWQSLFWQPSPDILQRGSRLAVEHTSSVSLVQRLQYESFALDMAADILRSIEEASPRQKRFGAHLESCLARLKDWLDSGEADGLSIRQMAKALATNPVDLQNGFRIRNGITIAAYLRKNRLEQAFQALRQYDLSVEEAAAMAGYEHVSSFSAAFRKMYGFPPSQAR